MEAKELFILNETYPLPMDKYAEFKSRRDGCAANPMCINKLKFDAETFIADFGKKVGSKLETGEESGFTILNEEIDVPSISEIKKKPNYELIVLCVIFAIGAYALIKKSTTAGAIALVSLMSLVFIMPKQPDK